jgi:hypothetical protein
LVDNAAGAFLTIARAINEAYSLDVAGFVVTIQLGDGTYTAGATASGPLVGGSSAGEQLVVRGNSGTPGNVIVSVTSANCFVAQNGARLRVQDMELRTTTVGSCLVALSSGQVSYSNIRFGACAGDHKMAFDHGRMYGTGNYAIVGSAGGHEHAYAFGVIQNLSLTVTLTGTPAFANYFLGLANGMATYLAVTYSGSATGTRYLVWKNAVAETNGGGANFFPGNAAGTPSPGVLGPTGGIYI